MVEPLMQLLGLWLICGLNSCKLTLLHQSLHETSDEIWPSLMALWTSMYESWAQAHRYVIVWNFIRCSHTHCWMWVICLASFSRQLPGQQHRSTGSHRSPLKMLWISLYLSKTNRGCWRSESENILFISWFFQVNIPTWQGVVNIPTWQGVVCWREKFSTIWQKILGVFYTYR
jgi:hypothetical protein